MSDNATARVLPAARPDLAVDVPTALAQPDALAAPWWPVSRAEILAVYGALGRDLATIARERAAAGDETGELLAAVLVHYALDEVISLYHARAVHRRADAEGASVLPPRHSRLYRALAEGRVPDAPPVLAKLRAGPSRARWPRVAARYLRRPFVRDGMRQRPPALTDWRNDTILTIRNTLAFRHAEATGVVPVLGRHETWFGPVAPEAERAARAALEDNPIAGAVVDAVEAAFAAGSETLTDDLARYCRDLFVAIAALARCQMANAARRPQRLPMQLWTGSGGVLWDRLLRHVVRRHGGTVTGHDHGFGAGHRADNNKAILDFDACDRFVTFSEAQVAALRRNLDPAMMLQSSVPELLTVSGAVAPSTPAAPRAGERRRAIYVAGGFDGERTRSYPKLPLPVALDWQRRLFEHLAALGWSVVYKYHPDLSPSEDVLRRLFGVEVLGGRLERVSHEADVIILDWPNTTAFGAAMLTDRPVVYVDLGVARLDVEAERLLQQRCAIVAGAFDTDNRVALDWDAFDRALAQAPSLNDHAYGRTFLGAGGDG